jgi:hypothetical protein
MLKIVFDASTGSIFRAFCEGASLTESLKRLNTGRVRFIGRRSGRSPTENANPGAARFKKILEAFPQRLVRVQ